LEVSVISYSNNQSTDLNLWNGVFSPVLLIGVKKFLSSDVQNITYSLLRIGTFIKQYSLGDKPEKYFPELMEVGTAAWKLIKVIYESKWDKLFTDKNNKSF